MKKLNWKFLMLVLILLSVNLHHNEYMLYQIYLQISANESPAHLFVIISFFFSFFSLYFMYWNHSNLMLAHIPSSHSSYRINSTGLLSLIIFSLVLEILTRHTAIANHIFFPFSLLFLVYQLIFMRFVMSPENFSIKYIFILLITVEKQFNLGVWPQYFRSTTYYT